MCLAFFVVLCSALARGDALTPEVREARRQEIARKSESERARLQRNFKAFRDLSPAEQDRLPSVRQGTEGRRPRRRQIAAGDE